MVRVHVETIMCLTFLRFKCEYAFVTIHVSGGSPRSSFRLDGVAIHVTYLGYSISIKFLTL